MPMPAQLVLPLQQHIGQAAEVVVTVGDEVKKGQVMARAADYVSASLHAPPRAGQRHRRTPIAHPSGLSCTCIVIDSRRRGPVGRTAQADTRFRSVICGQRCASASAGPASSDSAAPHSRPRSRSTPAGTPDRDPDHQRRRVRALHHLRRHADARAMPPMIVEGIAILLHIVGAANECLIGIEDNKPEADRRLRRRSQESLE
jgi:electron transport complex protein RnfC